jgi:cell division protein YceG involved in septum cleavage
MSIGLKMDEDKKDKKNKFKYEILIVLSLVFIIYGIILVNINLADLAKGNSAFSVSVNNKPSELVIDLGEKQVIFSTKVFKDFTDGTVVIFKVVKEQITSLTN